MERLFIQAKAANGQEQGRLHGTLLALLGIQTASKNPKEINRLIEKAISDRRTALGMS